MGKLKCELYNDSMQNWKYYPIQKAQLVHRGENKNGELSNTDKHKMNE